MLTTESSDDFKPTIISMLARKIDSKCSANAAAAAIMMGVSACGSSDPGEGTVRVMAYGEEFIEEGIAASDMNDGWTIDFDRFEVTIAGVRIGGEELVQPVVVDLAAPSDGEGHEVGRLTVSAGDHEGSSFEILRFEIEGSATRDDDVKTFRWDFESPVRYAQCETTTSVVDGETATFQITVHADHLFYDSLVATTPQLLFSPLADADVNGDGEITSQELEATDIGSYDPGNQDVNDLWNFLIASSGTVGHVDGEGHCVAKPIDE